MHDCFVIYSYVVYVEPFGNEPFVFFTSKDTTCFKVDLNSSLF